MFRNNGGLMGVRRVPSSSQAGGMWFANDHTVYRRENKWPPALSPDPYYNNLDFLLKLNGVGTNPVIVDDGPAGKTITNIGDGSIISTSKFGAGSYYVPQGSEGYINTGSVTLGSNDFAFDCWYYINDNVPRIDTLFRIYLSDGSNESYVLKLTENLITTLVPTVMYERYDLVLFKFDADDNFYSAANVVVSASNLITFTPGTWNHVALTRQNGFFRVFWNGIQCGGKDNQTAHIPSGTMRVAYHTSGQTGQSGYFDQIRLTTNAPRYVSTFTPPTSEDQ